MAHTPGEWVAGWDGDIGEWTESGRGLVIIAESRGAICYLVQRPEVEDNARLLKSAPDLLAACEAALDWMTTGLDRYEGEPVEPIEEQLRAARAKARGEGK